MPSDKITGGVGAGSGAVVPGSVSPGSTTVGGGEVGALMRALEEAKWTASVEAEQRARFQEMVRGYALTQVRT